MIARRSTLARRYGALASCLLSMLASGCVEQIMLSSVVNNMRQTEGSLESLHDYELARQVSESAIGQLEGLYRLDPDDSDTHYMLTRAWATTALRFMVDAAESAEASGDAGRGRYHALRAGAAFRRARFYATRWLVDRDDDFEIAVRSSGALAAWLEDEIDDAEDAPMLLWAGLSWAGDTLGSARASASDLDVGRQMIQRSVALDARAEHALGTILLSLDLAGRGERGAIALADAAVAASSGRYLAARLARAVVGSCLGEPQAEARAALAAIAGAVDPLPAARLDNLIATSRARRYLAAWDRFGPCPLPAGLKVGSRP